MTSVVLIMPIYGNTCDKCTIILLIFDAAVDSLDALIFVYFF